MRQVLRLSGDINVATLSQVRQALLTIRVDLCKLHLQSEQDIELMRNIQEVINENCSLLSILEGELTNAGVK